MSFSRISVSSALLAQLALLVSAQTYSESWGVYTVTQDTGDDVELVDKKFPYPDLPYQADTGDGARGTQQGYNLCNSTTQNQDSWCQTAFLNDISDFCMWGSPIADETVGDVEEEMVAFCTTPKYGTRLFPEGTFQGVQWIVTKDYIEVVGYLDQTKINLLANDTGGEEDPHGADNRGNPLGSLVYSSAFLSTNPDAVDYVQVTEWDYFVGSGMFCFKACDPAGSNAAELCQHTYDEVGCYYNSPASYSEINGTFTSCLGDDQLPVGEYVSDGITYTWAQTTGFTVVPYTASIPSTSSCSTYTSSALWTELYGASTSTSASSSASTSGSSSSKSSSSKASGSATGSLSTASSTSTGSSSSSDSSFATKDIKIGATWLAGSLLTSVAVLGWAFV